MNVFQMIGQIFKPAMQMIDEVHTSTEEKLTRKAELLAIQVNFLDQALAYEQEQLKAKTAIIMAEANSQSWLARNWRPITMLTFLALVCADAFGYLPFRLADDAWTLLQLGLGGYVVGRSAEKVTSGIATALKKKEQT